jgi:Protein of Unknown function (DUF2784)
MWAGLLADAVLLVHLGLVLFAILGGIGLRWRPWWPWLHLPYLVWAALVNLVPFTCPLTPIENTLRRAAGEAGYEGGFVAHYVTALVYPEGMTREVELVAGIAVLVWNAALYAAVLTWRRARRPASNS